MSALPAIHIKRGSQGLRALACLLLVLCAGCSAPVETNEIRFALSRAPINLDPRYATDAASERLNRLLYQRLVEFDNISRPVPGIATWRQLSAKHYRLTLHDTTSDFHHGRHLTADDVVATYYSVLDPATASPHRALLENIASLQLVDRLTVDFRLKRPDSLFPARLNIGILPADLLQAKHDFHAAPVGSGPFRFEGSAGQGEYVMQRIADKQQFRFVEVRDPTVRLLKLVRGEVDILQNDIAPELIAWLGAHDNIIVSRRPGNNFTYLGLNMASSKLADVKTRKAIALAIDRRALIDYMLRGNARTAESVLAPEHWAGHKHLPGYAFDPARSRKLLAEAGWSKNNPLRLSYKTSTDPLRVRIATAISSQLAMVGVQLDVQSMDWGTFYGDIKAGNFELYSLSWVGIRSPDIFEYVFHSRSVPPNGANRGRYTSKQADELITDGLQQASLQAMLLQLNTLQELLHQDLPYIPLWYEDHVFAGRNSISGYQLAEDGSYDGLVNVRRQNNPVKQAHVQTGQDYEKN
jgi:peptide/nickel transport system substrate-binding protein